jgi:hypothetical protein
MSNSIVRPLPRQYIVAVHTPSYADEGNMSFLSGFANQRRTMDIHKLPWILTLLLVLSVPHQLVASDRAQNEVSCHNGDPSCGLPGTPQRTLLESLYKGLEDLPVGMHGRAIGFLADVLAAAYGIDVSGSRFSLRGTLKAVATFPIERHRQQLESIGL